MALRPTVTQVIVSLWYSSDSDRNLGRSSHRVAAAATYVSWPSSRNAARNDAPISATLVLHPSKEMVSSLPQWQNMSKNIYIKYMDEEGQPFRVNSQASFNAQLLYFFLSIYWFRAVDGWWWRFTQFTYAVGCYSVHISFVQSARSKLHVIPKFMRFMSGRSDLLWTCEIVKMAQCITGPRSVEMQ